MGCVPSPPPGLRGPPRLCLTSTPQAAPGSRQHTAPLPLDAAHSATDQICSLAGVALPHQPSSPPRTELLSAVPLPWGTAGLPARRLGSSGPGVCGLGRSRAPGWARSGVATWPAVSARCSSRTRTEMRAEFRSQKSRVSVHVCVLLIRGESGPRGLSKGSRSKQLFSGPA